MSDNGQRNGSEGDNNGYTPSMNRQVRLGNGTNRDTVVIRSALNRSARAAAGTGHHGGLARASRVLDEETYNVNVETFLSNLQENTRRLEGGARTQGIYLDAANRPLLYHDASFCDTWRKFSKALEQFDNCAGDDLLGLVGEDLSFCGGSNDNSEIKYLFMSNMELPKEVLDILSPALRSKRLKTLYLFNNNFGSYGISYLADLLEHNPTLEVLQLKKNPLQNIEAVSRLSKSLTKLTNFRQLSITDCGIGNDPEIMSAIFHTISSCPALRDVDLRSNQIRLHGLSKLAQYISTNPLLEVLSLDFNQINDNDIILLAQALRTNTNLKTLNLSNNHITQAGADALIKAVFDISSLNAVADSNHTCLLDVFHIGQGWTMEEQVKRIFGIGSHHATPEERKNLKLFLAMHANGLETDTNKGYFGLSVLLRLDIYLWLDGSKINGKYLEDVPLELMPNVLEFIQKDPLVQENPLTVVFGVLRSWKMPLIFNNL